MTYLVVSIAIIAIVLFAISFFMDDKVKRLEDQVEQMSVATLQDTYQMKKKIKVLEEELLADNVNPNPIHEMPDSVKHKPLLIQKVYHLHQQGYSNDDIAKHTNLDPHDIQTILNNNV